MSCPLFSSTSVELVIESTVKNSVAPEPLLWVVSNTCPTYIPAVLATVKVFSVRPVVVAVNVVKATFRYSALSVPATSPPIFLPVHTKLEPFVTV